MHLSWIIIPIILGLLLVIIIVLLAEIWVYQTNNKIVYNPIIPIETVKESVSAEPSKPIEEKKGYYKFKGLIREQLACQTLEKIYNKGFPTVRPEFLINPETGQRMEYDCYNEQEKIAIEVNGEQHYVFPNKYHKTIQEFEAQVRRDRYKFDISNKYGIYHISVPYWVPNELISDWVEYYLPEKVNQRQKIQELLVKHEK